MVGGEITNLKLQIPNKFKRPIPNDQNEWVGKFNFWRLEFDAFP
jgi:hypothetical protein